MVGVVHKYYTIYVIIMHTHHKIDNIKRLLVSTLLSWNVKTDKEMLCCSRASVRYRNLHTMLGDTIACSMLDHFFISFHILVALSVL